jgi:hypothetical protein
MEPGSGSELQLETQAESMSTGIGTGIEEKDDVLSGNLFKKARLRSKWLVLQNFIERPWSLRLFEIHKSKRCLKYFENAKQKGEINLRGLNAKEVPSLNDSDHKHVFVIFDATGLEVLTLSGSNKDNTEEWVNFLNAVALGKPLKSLRAPKIKKSTSNTSLSASPLKPSENNKNPNDENFFREFSMHSFTSGSESSEEQVEARPGMKAKKSRRSLSSSGSLPQAQNNCPDGAKDGMAVMAVSPSSLSIPVVAAPVNKCLAAPLINAAFDSEEIEAEETGLNHGISLGCLVAMRDFVLSSLNPNSSVHDVCEYLIKPAVADYEMSFVSLLKLDVFESLARRSKFLKALAECNSSSSRPLFVEKAHIFVSYCWTNSFVDVVNALERFCQNFLTESTLEGSYDDVTEVGLWLDFVCENQFKSGLLPSQWFETTYPQLIQSIGHTALVLLPEAQCSAVDESPELSCPVDATGNFPAFCRTWNLWELLCTMNADCRLSIIHSVAFEECDISVIGDSSDDKLTKFINTKFTYFRLIAGAIMTINLMNSYANDYAYRQRILESIAWSHGKRDQQTARNLNSWLIINDAAGHLRYGILLWFVLAFWQSLRISEEYLESIEARVQCCRKMLDTLLELDAYFAIPAVCSCIRSEICAFGRDNAAALEGPSLQSFLLRLDGIEAEALLCVSSTALAAQKRSCELMYSTSSLLGKDKTSLNSEESVLLRTALNGVCSILITSGQVDDMVNALIPVATNQSRVDSSSSAPFFTDPGSLDCNHNYAVVLFAEGYSVQASYIARKLVTMLGEDSCASFVHEKSVHISGTDETSSDADVYSRSRYFASVNNYIAYEFCCGGDLTAAQDLLRRSLFMLFRKYSGSVDVDAGADSSRCQYEFLTDKAYCTSIIRSIPATETGAYLCSLYNCYLLLRNELSEREIVGLAYYVLLLNCTSSGYNSRLTHLLMCSYARAQFLNGDLLEAEKYYSASLLWLRSNIQGSEVIAADDSNRYFCSETLDCMAGLARVYRETRTTESLIESQKLYVEVIEHLDKKRAAIHKHTAKAGKQHLEKLKSSYEYRNQTLFLAKCIFYLSSIKIQRSLYGESTMLLERCAELYASTQGASSTLYIKANEMKVRAQELLDVNE